MTNLGARLSGVSKKILGEEVHLFLAYATIIFRPGATPPRLQQPASAGPGPVPSEWTPDEYKLFIEEARIDFANQQADKRDIRARAQIALTTALLVSGLLVSSYGSKGDLCASGDLLYGCAGFAIVLAVLGSGGIITARSDIGTVSVTSLTHYNTGELQHTVAEGYASTRLVGAETVAVMVTVLRDCVLTLVVGSALLALAHLTQ